MADKLYIDNTEATEAWNTVLFDRFATTDTSSSPR